MWDWFISFLTQVLAGIQGFVGDWGLAVIVLTIIIRLILTPLQTKSVKSTAGMQVMQPRIQEIQEKYADDPQRLQEETMKVYSEMHVNPLMGCLPLIIQMPVFFALFTVIKNVPTDACFYSILPSISDSVSGVLAASGFVAALPYIIMDVLFGVLTFIPMMLNPPKRIAPKKPFIGFHATKITSATAIQPRPFTTSSCQIGIRIIDKYAPPRPQSAPPTKICTYLYKVM